MTGRLGAPFVCVSLSLSHVDINRQNFKNPDSTLPQPTVFCLFATRTVSYEGNQVWGDIGGECNSHAPVGSHCADG